MFFAFVTQLRLLYISVFFVAIQLCKRVATTESEEEEYIMGSIVSPRPYLFTPPKKHIASVVWYTICNITTNVPTATMQFRKAK